MKTSFCPLRIPIRISKCPPISWFEAWSDWVRLVFPLLQRVLCSQTPCYGKQASAASQSRAHHATLLFPGTHSGVSLCYQHSCLPCQSFTTIRLVQPKTYMLSGYLASPPTPSLGMNSYGIRLPPKACCALILLSNSCHFINKRETVSHHCKVVHLHDPGGQF